MTARIPPHDLTAEGAVLSACMLSQEALDAARDVVNPAHFYADANRRVAEAIWALDDAGAPVDVVAVASRLSDAGRLQQVGGMAYLAELIDATPAVANVAHHAALVRGKARLRAVIAECQLRAAEGYGEVEDVEAWCDQVEAGVFAASQRDADPEGPSRIDELVTAVVTDATQRQQQGAPPGPSWGWRDLDRKIGKPKPYVYVVAGRPGMGKSAFAQGIAVNMAKQGLAAGFISLEMLAEQITERAVVCEGKVDAKRLRAGKLNPEDFERFIDAAAQVGKLPLQIRYRPGATVSQIRAAARKLFRELEKSHGAKPGVLVIDYLQLIDDQREKGETRDQAIGRITRALVRLAGELGVPIILLSQLNREVEKRPNKRPVMSDLRECVTGDTLVLLANGRRVPIRELVGQAPTVWACERGKLIRRRASSVWSVGQREVFTVTTRSGRRIKATAEHRLMGADGWTSVVDLKAGDRLALARSVPSPKSDAADWTDHRIALLGHLVGDGSYLTHQPLRYTTASEEYAQIVEAAAADFGCATRRSSRRGGWFQVLITGNGTRWKHTGVGAWLRGLGIWDQRSRDKRLPAEVFEFSERQCALLLRHLWATDGTIYSLRRGKRSWIQVSFTTCSHGLADDVAALLLRLGIVARIVELPKKAARSGTVYSVQITSGPEQARFLRTVGADGHRAGQAARALEAIEARGCSNTNVDTLPKQVWDQVRARMKERGMSQRAMAKARGTAYGGDSHFSFAPSRPTIAHYAKLLDDKSLAARATDDLFWDTVASVEPAGVEEVFDLTVPGPACWLADGIVSHNSGNVEQDAHAILFLYRDDYYNPDSEDRGIAEVVVGKDRNGGSGWIKLKFTGEYTRFDSLAPVDLPDGFEDDFDGAADLMGAGA